MKMNDTPLTLGNVPDDFPHDGTPASLAGSQPKLAGRIINGKFVVGQTMEERFGRWDVCEDLAQQLVRSGTKDAATHPEYSHEKVLQRVRRSVEGTGWCSVVETDWLMHRLRTLLGW